MTKRQDWLKLPQYVTDGEFAYERIAYFIAMGQARSRQRNPPQLPRAFIAKALRALWGTAETCPFCGKYPRIGPTKPWEDGNAFGFVRCVNSRCPAQPMVRDGSTIADERGTPAYIAQAIRRWNRQSYHQAPPD